MWLKRTKVRRKTAVVISLLLMLQPFVVTFASPAASAVENQALEQKLEIQSNNSSQPSVSQASTLEKPTNGQPHDSLKPASFNLTWDAVSGEEGEVITYHLRIASGLTDDDELDPTKMHEFTATSASFAFAESQLGEGKWYWQVQAVGADTRTSEWSEIWHVTVDATLPVIIITQPNGVYGGPQTMQIPFSAEVTDAGGIKRCIVMQDDGTSVPLGENNSAGITADESVTHLTLTGSISAASLGEGTHGVTVIVDDLAGNQGQKQQTYFVDKTAPQLLSNITDSQKLRGVTTITLTTEDATLETSSITILDNTSAPLALKEENAELSIASPETKTLTWDTRTVGDGTYRIQFFAKDAAGNETIITREVVVYNNDSLPGVGVVDPTGPTVDPLLDQLSKQLAQPFPAPQGFEVAPAIFANATEGVSEEVATLTAATMPETDKGIAPVAVAPTESGWRILGVLWYWWALTAGAFGVVILKWRSIWDATTLVLRK